MLARSTGSRERRWTRRQALGAVAGMASMPAMAQTPVGASNQKNFGAVSYCWGIRRRQQKQEANVDLFEPKRLLEEAKRLGASGIQVDLGVMSQSQADELGQWAQGNGMFLEGIVGLPGAKASSGEWDRLEGEFKTASWLHVPAVRTTLLPGRRYEQFQRRSDFDDFLRDAKKRLERAVQLAERWKVPLALENHKDQRLQERMDLHRSLPSEYLGACLDTGNNIALLDDPMETVQALAPLAMTVHLKDQGVQLTEDGFLLGDIPLGQGCLDLAGMVQTLLKSRPNVHFCLELITRDALRIPCLDQRYWQTMRDVSGAELARMLAWVRHNGAASLQKVSQLPWKDQVHLEEQNLKASFQYGREKLNLG
jgi:sugar phosphate isomerase/epimerase